MNRNRLKKLIENIIPLLILIITIAITIKGNKMLVAYRSFVSTLPYLICSFCIFACFWFEHSRVFYNAISILFSYVVLTSTQNWAGDKETYFYAVSIFIPANIIIFSFLKEDGITGKNGLLKLLYIATGITLIILDANSNNPLFLRLSVINIKLGQSTSLHSVPKLAIVLIIIGIAILLARFYNTLKNLDTSFISILIAFFVILYVKGQEEMLYLYYSTIYLILLVSILQTSYSMAFIDPLTGLLSRRAFEHELIRLSRKYSIAMVDIDHFKKINDTFGHTIGDQALKLISSVILTTSGNLKVFRYGGEEFAIIFKNKTVNDIYDTLEELRMKIEKRPLLIRDKIRPHKRPKNPRYFKTDNKKVHITVSIGVGQKNEKHKKPIDVINQADRALYKAKKKGRNCVMR